MAKKGCIPWNKGKIGIYKMTEETKNKMSISGKGKHKYWLGKKRPPFTEIHKQNMSKASRIKDYSFMIGHVGYMTGKKHSEETKDKMSKIHKEKGTGKWMKGRPNQSGVTLKGDKSPFWKGGISKNPYPTEFNKELKLKIRTRDNFTCCLCGRTEREELEELNRVLSVNHIDYDKTNLNEFNLNTLCCRCNIKINRERDYWTNYFMS